MNVDGNDLRSADTDIGSSKAEFSSEFIIARASGIGGEYLALRRVREEKPLALFMIQRIKQTRGFMTSILFTTAKLGSSLSNQ
jgi:hypothetical protein